MKKLIINIVMVLLCLLIGFGAGALVMKYVVKQQAQKEEKTPASGMTATPIVVPTNTPVPVWIITPTQTPGPTSTNTPTPPPSPSLTPMNTPTPSPSPTPTNTPTNTPTPTPSPTPTPMPEWTKDEDGFYGALRVEGRHLLGEDDCLVQLRGVSTHGLGWFPGYVNEAMMAQLRQEWGCNVFRLAMYTAESNGYCTSGSAQKENLKKIIDTGVRAAVEQEMYVIIDWHILSDGNPAIYKDEAKKFFTEMAKKYGDIPNVIYEICNEPNGRGDWKTIKEYALEIIPVIREYAPEAIIIVGTPTWSQDVDIAAEDPITGYDNIMYALHFYAATHKDNLREKCRTAVKHGLPLFVSEYGICDASGNGAIDEVQAEKWIDLLDSYGISHVMWNLSNKAETCAMIKSSCSKMDSLAAEELSPSGVWFLKMMGKPGAGNEKFELPEPIVTPTLIPTLQPTPTAGPIEEPQPEETSGIVENPTVNKIFELPDNLELTVAGNWPAGSGQAYQFNVIIKNTGTVEEIDWIREIKIKEGQNAAVSQSWCTKLKEEGNRIVFTPEEYNKTIPAGGEITGIGIIVEVQE